MSKEKNNIDNAFKEKLLNREFAFDPAAWAMAEKMLDKNRGKGIWFFRKGLIAISSIIVLSTALLWSINDSDIYANQGIKNQYYSKLDQPKVDQKEIYEPKEESVSDIKSPAINVGSVAISSRISDKQEEVIPISKHGSAHLNSASDNNKLAEPTVSKSTVIKDNKGNEPLFDSKREALAISDNSGHKLIQLTRSNEPLKKITNEQIEEGTNKENQLISSADEVSSLSEAEPLLPIEPDFDNDFEKEIIKGKTDLLKRDEGLINLLASRIRIITGIGPGITTLKLDNDYSYSNQVFAGLSYSQPLQKQFSLNANVIYYHTGRMNVPIEIASYQYDFGFSNSIQRVSTKTINQLSIPIYLNYFFGGRHYVYAGGETAILINSRTTSEQINESSFSESELTLKEQKSIDDQLQKLRFGVLFGYEYSLNEHFQIGLRYRRLFGSAFEKEYIQKDYSSQAILLTMGYNLNLK